MRSRSFWIGFGTAAFLLLLAVAAPAQEERAEITELTIEAGESALAYERATRWGWTQRELIYVDTLKGEIPMDGAPAYRPPREEPEPTRRTTEINPTGVSLLILLGGILAFLLWKFGAPASAMFGSKPGDPARRAPEAVPVQTDHQPTGLEALRAMADREEALVLLVEGSLERSASANNMAIRRSETARETLRRLPRGWAHMKNLRQIVMAEELVQFGGRELTDDIFEASLAAARPIWGAAA